MKCRNNNSKIKGHKSTHLATVFFSFQWDGKMQPYPKNVWMGDGGIGIWRIVQKRDSDTKSFAKLAENLILENVTFGSFCSSTLAALIYFPNYIQAAGNVEPGQRASNEIKFGVRRT